MSQIYNSIKSLITTEMVSKAAETLGENNSKISSGVSTLVPSLLASLIKLGDNRHIMEIVQEAGKVNLYSHISDFFHGSGIVDGRNYGERMENALIGPKNRDFISDVASKSGLAYESADRLSNWVSATIAAYLSKRVMDDNVSCSDIIRDLRSEQEQIKADIPSSIYSTLGLTPIMGAYNAAANVQHTQKPAQPQRACAANTGKGTTTNEPKKKGNGWLWWLILGLLLLVLLIFWWRSCDSKKNQHLAYKTKQEKVQVDNKKDVHMTSNTTTTAVKKEANLVEHIMPNGGKMVYCKGGCEDKVISMIKDEKFKTMTDADLKHTWMVMDDIEFKHNSATEFEPGKRGQLDNLAKLMKNYPEVKVKIGGFADETGTRVENFELSKKRAEFLKAELVKDGIRADRIVTEGFGEEFATVPASASNEARAHDRTIAMRLAK